MTSKEFSNFLVSIGGLESGYFKDRPPITSNICECGNGWLQLIHDLIEELVNTGWNKEICQIKEKFGGLRFYTNGLIDEQWKILSKYEKLASKTCEYCGTIEEVELRDDHGWLSTLCNKCYKNK